MSLLLKNGYVFKDEKLYHTDVFISGDSFRISGFPVDKCNSVFADNSAVSFNSVDIGGCVVFPGFTDVHVHFREPGFSYKETIKSGGLAAAHGGYTTVLTMPNLNPVPDCLQSLEKQLDIIRRDSAINILPYGAITQGELGERLSDMDKTAPFVAAFSDDGLGVQSDDVMKAAMIKARSLGKLIVAHCEDNRLLHGGYIHAGAYAASHGHRGICSESEWRQIARDLALVKETGVSYHICHISCKESVELIRQAKREGLDVSCETAPHYLLLDDSMLEEDGRFKMNPPVRDKADKEALIEGITDGTIDMVATDHAPHSAEEKSRGLEKSLMGIVGIETAFSLLYTELVRKQVIPLERLIDLLCSSPNRRFGLPDAWESRRADLTVFNLNEKYTVNPADFLSMGRSTPFEGREVYGKCKLTLAGGKIAWQDKMNITEE